MKINQLLLSVLIVNFSLISLSSCKKHEDVQCPAIHLEQAKDGSVKELFSKVEVVALENKDDFFLSGVNTLFVTKDYYVVSDSRNIIYVYNKAGKLLSDSRNKIGKGPNEYSIVTAFSVNPFTKMIEVATPQHLLFYDSHFNLVKKLEIPTKPSNNNGENFLFYGHIYDFSDHLHALIPTSVSKNHNSVFIFDSSTSKITKQIDLSEDYIAGINMQEHCFFDNGAATIGFVPPFFTGHFYAFDKKTQTLSKSYTLDFGANGLKQADVEHYGNNQEKLQSFLMSTDKEIPVNVLETENYLISIVKKGNDLHNWYSCFYNKSSHDIWKIASYTGKKKNFPIIKFTDRNHLYCAVDKATLASLLDSMKEQGVNLECNSPLQDDMFILEYTLK